MNENDAEGTINNNISLLSTFEFSAISEEVYTELCNLKLCKMKTQFGLRNVELDWFTSYLANREQVCDITAKLREAFLFQVPNSFGIFLITFAILKNPFAKKVANLLMEFAMFLS